MSEFERPMPPHRLVTTHHNDDLPAVAYRELGDANRWIEIAWLNKLVPPYITRSESQVAPGVVLSGSTLRVPAPTGFTGSQASDNEIFERDCEMRNRQLVIENGDLAVVSGTANLTQQLRHRIDTPRGQLPRHAEYGCLIWRLKGTVAGPTSAIMGAEYVKSALLADYRVASVPSSTARNQGDVTHYTAVAQAITGEELAVYNDQGGA